MMIMLTPLNWKAGGVSDAGGPEPSTIPVEFPPELPPERGAVG